MEIFSVSRVSEISKSISKLPKILFVNFPGDIHTFFASEAPDLTYTSYNRYHTIIIKKDGITDRQGRSIWKRIKSSESSSDFSHDGKNMFISSQSTIKDDPIYLALSY